MTRTWDLVSDPKNPKNLVSFPWLVSFFQMSCSCSCVRHVGLLLSVGAKPTPEGVVHREVV